MQDGIFTEKLRVAITGTLWAPRAEVAELINATSNAVFVPSVNYDTHYLAASITSSKKVRKAALLGTTVIGEIELRQYIESGSFPSTQLPARPIHRPDNFPEIMWIERYPEGIPHLLEYRDAAGLYSIRTIIVTGTGYSLGDRSISWVGGYDGPTFKTWRGDRIINLEMRS